MREGNNDVGGRLVEFTGREYMVRGRGYAKSTADLENAVLAASPSGVPVAVRDIGNVTVGPDLRRGVSDPDGRGEVVSGVIVMRQGENALRAMDRVKAKIKEIEPGMPAGVKLVTAYDRSETGRTIRAPGASRIFENISSSGPFELTIVTFERARLHYGDRKQLNFQLKEVLSEDRYNELWLKIKLVPAQAKRTFTGIVTDKMCGADHTALNVKPDAKCVRECVKAGSQHALVEGGSVYVLGNATKTNTILVDAITAAEPRP